MVPFRVTGQRQTCFQKEIPLYRLALGSQLHLIMIHHSHKVRKTIAGTDLPGIYVPGRKTQTRFHKATYRLSDGGSYMGRGLGEGMEEIMPMVTVFQQWAFYFVLFPFMLHSFAAPVAIYAAMI